MRFMTHGKGAALSALLACCAPFPAAAQSGPEAAALRAGEAFAAGLPLDRLGLRESMARLERSLAAAAKPAPAAAEPAQRIIPRFQQKRFPALAGGLCGLKSFTVLDYENRSNDGGFEQARISVMGAVIETTAPDCIRDYGVVQFIRGCAYHVRYALRTGVEVERTFDVARRLRGPRVVFSHPEFEVDTNDEDPLYSGSPETADRLGWAYVPAFPLRLRSDPASMLRDMRAFNEPDQRSLLMEHEGPTAVVFVADVPEGGVSMTDEEMTRVTVMNTSLDFRTCVYRLQDVPVSGSPAGEGVPPESGGPLHCFGWQSRYTYDFARRDFVTDRFQGVDPFCAQAPPRAALPGS